MRSGLYSVVTPSRQVTKADIDCTLCFPGVDERLDLFRSGGAILSRSNIQCRLRRRSGSYGYVKQRANYAVACLEKTKKIFRNSWWRWKASLTTRPRRFGVIFFGHFTLVYSSFSNMRSILPSHSRREHQYRSETVVSQVGKMCCFRWCGYPIR